MSSIQLLCSYVCMKSTRKMTSCIMSKHVVHGSERNAKVIYERRTHYCYNVFFLILSENPVPWQNWMAAYLGYTLRMSMLFRGWPIMVNDTHTRRRIKVVFFIVKAYWQVVNQTGWVRVRVRVSALHDADADSNACNVAGVSCNVADAAQTDACNVARVSCNVSCNINLSSHNTV